MIAMFFGLKSSGTRFVEARAHHGDQADQEQQAADQQREEARRRRGRSCRTGSAAPAGRRPARSRRGRGLAPGFGRSWEVRWSAPGRLAFEPCRNLSVAGRAPARRSPVATRRRSPYSAAVRLLLVEDDVVIARELLLRWGSRGWMAQARTTLARRRGSTGRQGRQLSLRPDRPRPRPARRRRPRLADALAPRRRQRCR